MALGVQSDTPRDGTRRNPFQQDSTRFKGDQKATVGETVGGGGNDLEAGTKAIMAETGTQLPQVTAGGEVDMTLHQVNADGGGPYTCMINTDGTATKWTDIQVTQSPPGENSRNRDGAKTDFPLKAAIPADASCTGTVAGQENVCLVRCQNAARAGPFGGVVPVQSKFANLRPSPPSPRLYALIEHDTNCDFTVAGTSTPATARRALAQAIKRDIQELKLMQKRARTFSPEDLAGLDDEEDEDDE